MSNKSMKRLPLFIAAAVSVVLLGGCSSVVKNIVSSNKSSAVQDMVLKKPSPAAENGDKILFVGNSHTYVNDLPGVFYSMAMAGGHEVEVYDLTEGYYTLKQFADPEDELGGILKEALEGDSWDFVILQENSNSALPANSKEEMFPPARELDELIRGAGGQTGFLMTWAPKDGAGPISRESVQDMLAESYITIADELDALLIPGGAAFLEALAENPDLELWDEDGQHPAREGTYLAACLAYGELFQETPVGNEFIDELEEETAKAMQAVAERVLKEHGGLE